MRVDASALADELSGGETLRDATRDFARLWFEEMQDKLLARGEQVGYEVHSVVQSGVPVHWDSDRGAWVTGFEHVAAEFLEEGTDEHTITPNDPDGWLAFEWEDGADVVLDEETGETVKERFSDTFPLVFFKEVDHPGTPALKYARDSRDIVAREMGS